MSPQCPATLNPEKKAISGVRRSERALTMNVYVKGVSEAQVSAMDALSEKLVLCNVRKFGGRQAFGVVNMFNETLRSAAASDSQAEERERTPVEERPRRCGSRTRYADAMAGHTEDRAGSANSSGYQHWSMRALRAAWKEELEEASRCSGWAA